jgi:hypothetical protein
MTKHCCVCSKPFTPTRGAVQVTCGGIDCIAEMGRRRMREYSRTGHRRATAGRMCLCGNPAVKWKNGPVCERCDKIEAAQEQHEARRARCGEAYSGIPIYGLHLPSTMTKGALCSI